MRINSGYIKSTLTYVVPHLSPYNFQKQDALLRECRKMANHRELPIHKDNADGRPTLS